ncbi:MAG: DUF3048 domain-containing protein [Candidatus Gastranaerophilales bacterium]|nr:DUF3048 domain-containing protein [Candidatus Gastranaerophilales bacterium]
MEKIKTGARLFVYIAILVILAVLTSCGKPDDIPEETSSFETDESTDSDVLSTGDSAGNGPAYVVVTDDTVPPHEGMVRSPLTNEWVDADVAATRPIAVIIPNEKDAVPHYNLSEASVVYEANVEGRMTRLMAIYEDWEKLDQIGNVRSLRSYFAYWSFEWDAFIVHYGGPYFIDDLIAEPTTENVNGNLSEDSSAFFRTTTRPAPHNGYVSGSGLMQVIKKKGYSLTYRGLTDENHFQFASKADPNTLAQYGFGARSAAYIDMSGCYPLTRCYFEYNEEDGLYYRYQRLIGDSDGPHTDAVTKEQLSFKNILVQVVKYEELGEGYLVFQCHDTTRDGWFFTNGRGIHVTWEKTSDYGATRYYDDYGNEVVLNTGKTMICVIEEGDDFTFW